MSVFFILDSWSANATGQYAGFAAASSGGGGGGGGGGGESGPGAQPNGTVSSGYAVPHWRSSK